MPMSCRRCGARALVTIELQTSEHYRVTMHSCGTCESRSWTGEGDDLQLQDVLAMLPPGLSRRG